MRRRERWQHALVDHFGPGRQSVQLRVKPGPPRLLFHGCLTAGRPKGANGGVALAPSARVLMETLVPAVVHEDPPHAIFSIGIFRSNSITQLYAVCRAGFSIVSATNTGM